MLNQSSLSIVVFLGSLTLLLNLSCSTLIKPSQQLANEAIPSITAPIKGSSESMAARLDKAGIGITLDQIDSPSGPEPIVSTLQWLDADGEPVIQFLKTKNIKEIRISAITARHNGYITLNPKENERLAPLLVLNSMYPESEAKFEMHLATLGMKYEFSALSPRASQLLDYLLSVAGKPYLEALSKLRIQKIILGGESRIRAFQRDFHLN